MRVLHRVCDVRPFAAHSLAHHASSGKIETIGDVKCYVATPVGEYTQDTVVLFLPDLFGLELVNSQVGILDGSLHG
jgi:hypothetical protein